MCVSPVAGLDQNLGWPTECQRDGLLEVHYRAPLFRPLAFLATLAALALAALAFVAFFTCPRHRVRFWVTDFVPGGFPFSFFSREIPRLFDPAGGEVPAELLEAGRVVESAENGY